jgi:hypothetical protein
MTRHGRLLKKSRHPEVRAKHASKGDGGNKLVAILRSPAISAFTRVFDALWPGASG